jgi:zinc finger protein 362/384
MRMDPKHQFAAQYMLSRAAAERREQIAAGGSSLLSIGQNSRGASPSALSDTSSCGRLSSPPPEHHNDNNNNGSGLNDSASDNNNNNGTANSGSIGNYNGKLSVNDVLRSQTSGHLHQQYQQVVAAANAITAAQNQQISCNGLGSPSNPATSAAQAVVNLAAAMRQNQSMSNGNQQSSPSHYHQNQSMAHHGHQPQHHQEPADAALRIQDVLRSQAEAALRLAVSQAAAVVASNGNGNDGNHNNQYRHNGSSYHHQGGASHNLQSQFTLEQALRLHGSELGLHHQNHQNHP